MRKIDHLSISRAFTDLVTFGKLLCWKNALDSQECPYFCCSNAWDAQAHSCAHEVYWPAIILESIAIYSSKEISYIK